MGETAFASFSPESMIMRLLQRIGFESLAWSLRRLYCPVSEEALVLEVGSGGNPYPGPMCFWMRMRRRVKGIGRH